MILKVKNATYKKGYKKAQIIFAIFIIIFIITLAALDTRLMFRYYEVKTNKVTDSIRIALITDLHSCRYGNDEDDLIKAIKLQHPDVILLGGDICDDIIANENAEALLKGITHDYPCYYVTGNHEYWGNDIHTIHRLFTTYGVTILNGSFVTVGVNDQQLNICGISDPDAMSYTTSGVDTKTQLEELSNVHKNGNYTLLLAHRPELIETYIDYNFDLVLSGHAHGGQWRLPGIINGLYAPNQGWFPKYAGGRYEIDETTMIVSRGLAKESTRVPRIFNRPELVMVTIEPY